MTVLVAVQDNDEGRHALATAVDEAKLLDTGLIVLNLAAEELAGIDLPADLQTEQIDRNGVSDDPVQAVLDELRDHPDVTRLVIGLRRRSPLGKAILGSIGQRLLLESPVPVLSVKQPS